MKIFIKVVILLHIFIIAAQGQVRVYPEIPVKYKKGGEQGLYEMIAKNFKYPRQSQANCIQGRVMVEFVITKTGIVDSVRCINHIDSFIDAEAVRLIKLSADNWEPAVLNGNIVNSRLIVPLAFDTQRPECTEKIQKELNSGLSRLNSGRYTKAIEHFHQTLHYEPSNTVALRHLGITLYEIAEQDSACFYWNQARYLFVVEGTSLFKTYCKGSAKHGL